jgi:hypothetical protein
VNNTEKKISCALAFPTDHSDEAILDAIATSTPLMDESSSLWLWVRGSYRDGSVSFSPYEIAKELKKQGWVVRNEIVWKCKAGDPAPDNRLKRTHETVFHLTMGKGYYYDRTMDGLIVSDQSFRRIGMSYAKKISDSPFLTAEEKANAQEALSNTILKLNSGEVADFRMIFRGTHQVDRRTAHKIDASGFHIRSSKKHAPMFGDVWDEWSNETNSCVPMEMVARMVKLTCPPGGHVIDIFPNISSAKAVMACGCNYLTGSLGVHKTIEKDVEGKPNLGVE